jgi:RNA polymerase sigma factor (TIGR02999 family)
MGDPLTAILQAIREGDLHASEQLLPVVYQELRRLAAHRLAQEAPGHTLEPTALVHEAYMRLVEAEAGGEPGWDSRGHFFAAAAEAMRRILIEHARARAAAKRGGQRRRLALDEATLAAEHYPEDLLDLDSALGRLAEEEPAKAQLVKLRFFGGLTLEQAALAMGISPATADRHWAYARAWLLAELSRPHDGS